MTYKHKLISGKSDDYLLTEYIDPIGRTTQYEYEVENIGFSFFSKNNFGKTNQLALIKSIKYPNGGTETLTYDKTIENLSNRGAIQKFRVSSNVISDTQGINETFTYSYSSNNYTGYPGYTDGNNLPGSFISSTSVIDARGIKTNSQYISKHFKTK